MPFGEQVNGEREEMIERVKLMATGDPQWDLSDNDQIALRSLLSEHAQLIDEISAAYDEIFPLVPQASDDEGKLLDLAGKIRILTNQFNQLSKGEK